jgi:hypothetical protein
MGNCCATTGEMTGQDLDTKPNGVTAGEKVVVHQKEDMSYNQAALKIQANFRGKMTRELVEHQYGFKHKKPVQT